jgi:hypothetical protein
MSKKIVLVMLLLVISTTAFAGKGKVCKLCNTSNGCGTTLFNGYTTCVWDPEFGICTLTGTCTNPAVPKTACAVNKVNYAVAFPWTVSPAFADQVATYDIRLADVIRVIQSSVKAEPLKYPGMTVKMRTSEGDVTVAFQGNTLRVSEPRMLVKELVFKGAAWTLHSIDGLELGHGLLQ